MKEFKVRKITTVLSMFAVTLLLSSCGSNEVKEDVADCVFPDAPDVAAPGWVCDEPVPGIAVSAVGVAEKSAAGHSFMKTMAVTAARAQLARNMRTEILDSVQQFAETTGAADSETVDKVNTSVTKQITNETLVGTKVYKTRTSPNGALYVLLGMDAENAAAATQNATKASMGNKQAEYQRFLADRAQDQLLLDVERLKK